MKDGKYTNKFEDGERVRLGDEVVTVRQWSYAPNLRMYNYSIVEYPSTFFFEYELKKVDAE